MFPIDRHLRTPHTGRLWAGALAVLILNAMAPAAWSQPAPAAGFSCVVLGRAGSQMKAGAAVVEPPVRLPACEGATALADGLSVCFINERRERKCRDLRKGEVVSRSAFNGSGTAGFGDTVMAMARGDVQTLPGQTRANARMVGLPFGQVLGDAGALTFDFTLDPRVAGASRIRITTDADNGSTLWESPVAAPSLKAPLSALKVDAWYRWVVEAEGRRSSGRFLLLGGSADAARSELAQIDADASLSTVARQYLKAELYSEHALLHERLLAINELRRLTAAR